MTNHIRVMIVDDQQLFCDGFRKLIEFEPDFEVVGVAGNGKEALSLAEALQVRQCLPDVVLMDVRMPVMDGIVATGIFHERWPSTHVVILTTFDDVELIQAGMQAGALGYLLKDISADQLAASIRAAALGQVLLLHPAAAKNIFTLLPSSPAQVNMPARVSTGSDLEHLTEREREILRLVARGASNREISEALFITGGTVKNHLSNILSKLGVRDRTQAALKARELGVC